MPGLGTTKTAAYRQIWASSSGRQYLPGGGVIAGSAARDPLNTGDVDTLRAGLLMGKVTATGKYAPSVIGVAGEAMDGDETEMTVAAAVVTELVRRIGASGTFKLVGPPTAAGTVRTVTVTYSAASGTAITITAMGVAEAQTITPSVSPTVGSWYVRYRGDNGVEVISAAIAYNATAATIQTALRAMHADLAAVVVTDSGNAGLSDGTVTVTWPQKGATGGPHSLLQPFAKGDLLATAVIVSLTCARDATGINGDFVTGSLICPTDGSETPVTFVDAADGIKVTLDNADVDVQFPHIPVAGVVDASQIVNYPADTSTQAWVKAALKAAGQFVFDDNV
jgi:hypothetical protein